MVYGNYPDLTSVKRVLVVKLRHHGDVLLTSPVFSHLKKVLPDAEIDAFIYGETLPMLEGHPAISNFLLYDKNLKKRSLLRRYMEEIKLLRRVRKGRYDLVLNLTEGDRGAIIAWVSGAKVRVGFDPEGAGFAGKRKIFTHLVKTPKGQRHTVERQLDALRRMGIFPAEEEKALDFRVPESALENIRKVLDERGVREGAYLLIHPISRWRFKCPPPAFTASLIEELKKKKMPVVLTSGPDPQERAFMQEITKAHPDVLDLGGKISLKELGALVKLSRGVICVDSVPLHIASALQTPIVAIFGPTSEKNWGPWMHPQAKIVAQPFSCRPCFLDGCGGSKRSECLYTLSTRDVMEALQSLELLDSKTTRSACPAVQYF